MQTYLLTLPTTWLQNADMSKTETARQTLTGIIRSRMASYQARQLAGVTQKTFAEELTNEGHPISYADFRTLYSRARKQLSSSITVAASAKPASPKEQKNAPSVAQKTDQKKQEVPPNPLTKKAGFKFKGTNSVDENDLI